MPSIVMDKQQKDILLAKISTLQTSQSEPVIQTLCTLLEEIVSSVEVTEKEIGFMKQK